MNQLIYPIQEELGRVQDNMNRHFHIKAGYLGDFVHLELCQLNNILRPVLVILSAGMFGKITDKVISLAGVLQYIYLASRIHRGIHEDEIILKEDTGDPRDGCQFPVLVGDYFFGRFFTTLCDAGIVEYLRPLSEIICVINEGSVMRLRKADSAKNSPLAGEELIRKETGEMLAGCCSLGARLNGAEKKNQEALGRFGMNLGVALGFMQRESGLERTAAYLGEARAELEKLPPGPGRKALGELVELFLRREVPLKRLVG